MPTNINMGEASAVTTAAENASTEAAAVPPTTVLPEDPMTGDGIKRKRYGGEQRLPGRE